MWNADGQVVGAVSGSGVAPGTRLGLGPGRSLAHLALVVAAVVGWSLFPARGMGSPKHPAPPTSGAALSPEALEARHGLRVTRVAVTGDGGLVDLRFTVVDPVKARPLLDAPGQDLRLLVEPGGTALAAPHHGAMRNIRLAKDAPCFVLFPNARGAVKAGGKVAVAFGGVRLAAVTVR